MAFLRIGVALIAVALLTAPNVKATNLTVGSTAPGSGLGLASETRFGSPTDAAVHGDVALVTDFGNKRIVAVSLTDGNSSEFLSTGTESPNSIVVCDNGTVGFFGANNGQVSQFDPSSGIIASPPFVSSSGSVNGLACTDDLLFVSDDTTGIRVYNRSAAPASSDDFVWNMSKVALGITQLRDVAVSPDQQHLAFGGGQNSWSFLGTGCCRDSAGGYSFYLRRSGVTQAQCETELMADDGLVGLSHSADGLYCYAYTHTPESDVPPELLTAGWIFGSGSLGGALELSYATTGGSCSVAAGVPADYQCWSYQDTGNPQVGTVNIATKQVTLYGSGTQGTVDGTASTAQFDQPHGVDWSQDSKTIIVNQAQDFAGLRFIDFASGTITSSENNLMPTVNGRGVQVLDGTGLTLVTYHHGIKLMQIDGASSQCAVAGVETQLKTQFPLLSAKAQLQLLTLSGTHIMSGQDLVLDECVPGFTSSGSVTAQCSGRQWVFVSNDFHCTSTALAAMIVQLNKTLLATAATIQDQIATIAILEQDRADADQNGVLASSQLPSLETSAQVHEQAPTPRQQGTVWLNSNLKPGLIFGDQVDNVTTVFKHDQNLVISASDAVLVQADVLVSGSLTVQGIDVLDALSNITQALEQLTNITNS